MSTPARRQNRSGKQPPKTGNLLIQLHHFGHLRVAIGTSQPKQRTQISYQSTNIFTKECTTNRSDQLYSSPVGPFFSRRSERGDGAAGAEHVPGLNPTLVLCACGGAGAAFEERRTRRSSEPLRVHPRCGAAALCPRTVATLLAEATAAFRHLGRPGGPACGCVGDDEMAAAPSEALQHPRHHRRAHLRPCRRNLSHLSPRGTP